MKKTKIIWRLSKIGAFTGLSATLIYIITGILFQETMIDSMMYCLSVFFAWPFGFFLPFFEEACESYIGTIIGFAVASSLGGFLYGAIIGLVIKGFSVISKLASQKEKGRDG